MTLKDAQSIFLHGIAGTGMRGLAYILSQQGKTISGSDTQLDANLKLTNEDDMSPYRLIKEADAAPLLSKADLLIYSDAVPASHPIREQAQSKTIPSLSYQAALGQLSSQFETIAIAGTHGKSSTTAFLAHILIEAGQDPTVLVGAAMPSLPGKHARFGQGKYFVVEADEYREHFLTLKSAHAVITSIDFDHPDYFASLEGVAETYNKFLKNINASGTVVMHAETKSVHPNLAWPEKTITASAELIENIKVPLPGEHMKRNAALAVTMAEQLGVSREAALHALATFPGLGRRFETVGTVGEMTVISDYGHHPAEIAATLAAAREKYPDKKIAAIFEAHMLERLETFFDEFISAFSAADLVLVYPPFIPSGRGGVTQANAAAKLLEGFHSQGTPAEIIRAVSDLPAALNRIKKDYDVAIAFTAGNLDRELRAAVN